MNHVLTVRALYDALDAKIPRALSCSWDNDGLMVCPDPDAHVKKILIALDATEDVVAFALEAHYDVIIAHHPLVFKGIKAVDGHDTVSRKVIRLLQGGVTVMSFHTRLDAVEGGVNDTLAARLGLTEVEGFNAAGACMGRVGKLSEPMTLDAFARLVKEKLNASGIFVGDSGRMVSRVAVLGGAGDSEVDVARDTGADTYVTGELKYHQLCDAPYEGMNLLEAGHYETEFPVCEVLRDMVVAICGEIGVDAPEITVMASNRIRLV